MMNKMESSSPQYSIQSPRRQYFSLPFGLVSLLLETESPHLLLKLQKSCKHFFAKKKLVVVDTTVNFRYSNEAYSVIPGHDRPFEIAFDKRIQYWFTRMFCEGGYSTIRFYVCRLTLKELSMTRQELSLNDIDYLLSNNKMEEIAFLGVNIRDAHGNPVPDDYILGKVPNIKRIIYGNECAIYSNDLLRKLNSIQFNHKFECFRLQMYQASEKIDAEILGDFVKRNLASDSVVSFCLPRNAPELKTVKRKLKQVVDAMVSNNGKKPNCQVVA